jgi:hypothetical protein
VIFAGQSGPLSGLLWHVWWLQATQRFESSAVIFRKPGRGRGYFIGLDR